MILSTIIRATVAALLLGLATTAGQAAVYKHVDENGNVIRYSDQPQNPGDKPINVPPPAMTFDSKPPKTTTFSTPSSSERKKEKSETLDTTYSAVTFVKPDNDEAIRANGGVFPVTVASQPALNTTAGHRYVVVVDGEKHQSSDSATFDLENMDRGTHSIKVQIENQKGNVLASSSSIKIHVLRASVRKTPRSR
ncbi:MAG: DUF4124 domain-containing protein [Gammaproteobacteria bacterium]|jgi:hypothetical protein